MSHKIEFDAVSREDVLAARVLRKALGGVAFVLTLVVALVAYAWRDISKQREEIETQRGQLKVQRDSLSAEVGRMQNDFQQKMVLNRWAQVVEEEKRTPVADSRFWVRFDDIRENTLTNVALWFDDGRGPLPVKDVPTTIRIADPLFVTVDQHRYRLLAQAQFRDKGRFGGHNDRVVFRLDRIVSDSAMRSSEKVRPVPP